MKRMIVSLVLVVLFSIPSLAVTVTVEIPAGAVAASDEICETVRLKLHKPFTMTKADCLQLIVNDGLRRFYFDGRKAVNDRTARQATSTQVSAFSDLLFDPIPAAFCGDGIVDPIYGEQCDDGNTANGDGCSSECQTE